MSARRPLLLSAAELERALLVPDAGETFSPIGGPGVLVLDVERSADEVPPAPFPRIEAALASLPCVTIALGPAPGLASLAAACDVHLEVREELDEFLAGFERTPISALAFVQLLRGFSRATAISQGLIAESFVYSTLQSGPEFQGWLAARIAARRRKSPAPPRDSGPPCLLERAGDRLEIRLNRPSRHNAFSSALRDALCDGLAVALADPSIDDVVLLGEGESFCSGGDLDEFGSFPDPAQAHAVRTTRSPALLIARLAGRIRSEIHGACIGAGIELPAFTDRIVASEDSFIELPEVRLGLVPGAGGTVSIARRIGRQRTAWLGLSGRRIDARTALAWGLVDEVRLRQHPPA